MQIKDLSASAEEQFLNGLQTMQSSIIDALGAFTTVTEKVVPARLRTVPAVPGFKSLPKPAEVVAFNFDLAEKLLVSQREFAQRLVSASPAASAE